MNGGARLLARGILGAFVLGLAALPSFAQEGKLDSVGEAVRGGSDSHDAEHDGQDEGFDDYEWADGGQGDFFDDPLGHILAWTVQLPFLVPRMMLDDSGGDSDFAAFPNQGEAGYWRVAGEELRNDWSLRPRVEYGGGIDDLERFGLGLEVEHASRFGLDATWNHWREELSGGGTDTLDLGDLNVVYRFATNAHTAFRAGLGLNGLHDERGEKLGFNTTYAVDVLPGGPLSAGLEFDLGTLGDATLQHARCELGVVFRRLGLFASFDHFDIDGVELRSFGLGLRGWF